MAKRTQKSSGQGNVALVTGASRGIGFSIADALAEHGYSVVITGREIASLKSAARRLEKRKTEILPVVCDVRSWEEVTELAQKVKSQFGRLNVLINNAGVSQPNLPVSKLPVQTWNEVIATNLTGIFLLTQAVLPLMKRGSVIVNNLSVAAKTAFPGSAAYCASKHGALGLTNVLREEFREKGIRIIALLPGATDTAIWNVLWPDAPRKKMMSPTSVAQIVVEAIEAPLDSTVEELTIRPSAGTL